MVIKASAAGEIRQLVASLDHDDLVHREAAIARLAVIGARAVDHLVSAYDAANSPRAKVAILRALEAIIDGRSVPVARRALREEEIVAAAAVGTLRPLLDGEAAAASQALDALVTVALDPAAPRQVRVEAIDALRDVPGDVSQRLSQALGSDPDPELLAHAGGGKQEAATADRLWQDATEGRLPESPGALRDLLRVRAPNAPLGVLQKLVDAVRAKEASLTEIASHDWLALRGTLHQALALRGSRLALYDLRETLAAARASLPVTFLAAVHVVGDDSLLEPLAAAYSQASDEQSHWRQQIAGAFRAVAARQRLTRRHAMIKRIGARWPDAVAAFYAQ